jgi:hypothetical protein
MPDYQEAVLKWNNAAAIANMRAAGARCRPAIGAIAGDI